MFEPCDRCNAKAQHLVTLQSGQLMFCGHHYNLYSERLAKIAIHTPVKV